MASKAKVAPKAGSGKPTARQGSIEVRNVNVPGYVTTVDAAKYAAVLAAMRKVLPLRAPGLTQGEMIAAVVPHLPQDLFPGGTKAGWWAKTVQLDQEAKGTLAREVTKPLRWHWVAKK